MAAENFNWNRTTINRASAWPQKTIVSWDIPNQEPNIYDQFLKLDKDNILDHWEI